ncbi:inner membrane protein [Thermoactinomyces sp. DSM 45891]|uniref:metal-dependent hydrolase n=1 Tax=Thermoactinomyces sp. DSM 45891 TaxID=1761907 RepID=UPI000920C46B|nr:metal-dependent hydrolase [Thermoactinomyces sp. DSM 45891]SFX67789.1 inner membrane protein [Thermoactinomyces sp. DSM 45891]
MDTGTHLVMGLGLFGLAQLDPVVANDLATAHAVLLGTIVGSQTPDIDTLYRLKGNPAYIRNHRGWTHSLPMWLVWPTLLTLVLHFVFPASSTAHVWLWSFIAVLVHVFIDLFNSYGTQALRPFSNKWVAWDIINIFDPFLFILHIAGFVIWWFFPAYAGYIFSSIYIVIGLYLIWRTCVHHRWLRWVKSQVNAPGSYTVIPTARWGQWNCVYETQTEVRMGEIRGGKLLWTGQLTTEFDHHPATHHSKQAEAIDAFLSFTSYGYPQVIEHPFGYEVRWLDVRYHHKKHFPFVAVAILDNRYNILHSFVGWISEGQLDKKIYEMMSATTTTIKNT